MLFNHLPHLLRASAPTPATFRNAESLDDLLHNLGREFGRGLGLVGFEVETDDAGATLTTALPGWAADELELSLEGRLLSLKGEKPLPADAPEGSKPKRRFHRRFELGFEPDPEGLTAELELGILTLRVPKLEKPGGRVIDIRSK